MLKKISVLFLSIVFVSTAKAGIAFAPAVTHMSQSLNDTTSTSDVKLTMIDFRLGYMWDMGLYVGGLYSLQDHDLLSDSSDSFFGPSIGYFYRGFFVSGTYYIYGERDFTNGSAKLANVQGYQIDVAYTVPITESVRIGPQMTHHNYKFKEIQVSGVAQPTDVRMNDWVPYFTLFFAFQ